MKPEVEAGFLTWSRQFEGYTDWLYLDVKGYVTIGIGLLVDPFFAANGLIFVTPQKRVATVNEVSSAWLRVKGAKNDILDGVKVTDLGGGHEYWQELTSLRATEESIRKLAVARLEHFQEVLTEFFPRFEDWPWRAQQATLSMAWAMGPGFPATWPHFTVACRAEQWETAAETCHMSEVGNRPLRPRNAANRLLFLEAAAGVLEEYREVAGEMWPPKWRGGKD